MVDYMTRLQKYVHFLEAEMKKSERSLDLYKSDKETSRARERSMATLLLRYGNLQEARDKLYSIFPELAPKTFLRERAKEGKLAQTAKSA